MSSGPQYSPDRKFFWDGERWQPVPNEPFMASLGGCLGWGCMIAIAAGAVLFILGAVLPH